MTFCITFTVYGIPQSRGSKKGFVYQDKSSGKPRVAMSDSNKKSGPWMAAIKAAAGEAYSGQLVSEAVRLSVKLWFPRPKSHYGSGRNSGTLKASASSEHTQTPDLGKCIRAIEDALSGVVLHDDRQIVEYRCRKGWTTNQARAEITVEAVE